ncbi:MAG TPA: Rieske 2Fe-2S domain-containing protein [Acidimicrobiales bacterium]|nr:Rieske 2Fe-2S domain-containing protein [Acidimicrobiales bacterium]
MRITATGHAGLFVETGAGSILCDPWRTPAYFASWFPFPSNDDVDFAGMNPDYLYVSHLHRDHFDPDLLGSDIPKSATVLLPAFPTDELREALTRLGFHKFVQTESGVPVDLDGLRVMITSLVSPTDGPIGDSALSVDDGRARLLNQNDARPVDIDELKAFGDYDAHFLQFSGAIWWPIVYDLADATKQAIARRKRENGMERARRFVDAIGARHVFPSAGPPCFLDDGLFEHNDFDGSEDNIFPDQRVFLRYLEENGHDNGVLLIPGSVATFEGGHVTVEEALPEAGIERIFDAKREVIGEYRDRHRTQIAAMKESWPRYGGDLADGLTKRFEPLLALADNIGAGVGAPLLIEIRADGTEDGGADEDVVVDFVTREVRRHRGEDCRYRFTIERRLVEALLATEEIDWVNSLFLSMRFKAARKGAFNEYLYTFFKCLSPERLSYAEGWYDEKEHSHELVRIGDWMVQRRCPHLKADLSRFGEICDGVLECSMHGWRFDLETGQCLTSESHHIVAEAAPADG